MRCLRTKLGHVAFSLAFIGLVSEAPVSAKEGTLPATDPVAEVLQALGEAYAKDARVPFTRVDIDETSRIETDAAGWTKRLQDALAVGYSPDAGEFLVIPFAKLKQVVKITMSRGRTPEETVNNVAQANRIVLRVTWHFGAHDPVKTYAVFSPNNTLLFDTMMFLPVLRGPLFAAHH